MIEGLAESFARELFGTERLGPWVTRFDHEDLQYSIDVINEVLDVKGVSEVSRYMFGDQLLTTKALSLQVYRLLRVMQLAIMPFSHL